VDATGSAGAFDGAPQGAKNLALCGIVRNSLGGHGDDRAMMQFEAPLATLRPGEELVGVHFLLGNADMADSGYAPADSGAGRARG